MSFVNTRTFTQPRPLPTPPPSAKPLARISALDLPPPYTPTESPSSSGPSPAYSPSGNSLLSSSSTFANVSRSQRPPLATPPPSSSTQSPISPLSSPPPLVPPSLLALAPLSIPFSRPKRTSTASFWSAEVLLSSVTPQDGAAHLPSPGSSVSPRRIGSRATPRSALSPASAFLTPESALSLAFSSAARIMSPISPHGLFSPITPLSTTSIECVAPPPSPEQPAREPVAVAAAPTSTTAEPRKGSVVIHSLAPGDQCAQWRPQVPSQLPPSRKSGRARGAPYPERSASASAVLEKENKHDHQKQQRGGAVARLVRSVSSSALVARKTHAPRSSLPTMTDDHFMPRQQ